MSLVSGIVLIFFHYFVHNIVNCRLENYLYIISNKKMRFVYIVRCNDNSLYTGITNNLEKRISDHNISKIWARYTKSRRPVKLIWHKKAMDRNIASKLELQIKKMWKQKKEEMIVLG